MRRPHSVVGEDLRAAFGKCDYGGASNSAVPPSIPLSPMQNLMPLTSPHGVAANTSDTNRFSTDHLAFVHHSDVVLPPPPQALSAAPSLPPILVADDDADDIYFVQRFIRKTGVKNRVI